MKHLSELDHLAINRILLYEPFNKEEVERAYKVFGIHYTLHFLGVVRQLAIGIDSALNLIGQLQDHYDIPSNWEEIDPTKQRSYFNAAMNWLRSIMKGTISLDAY
jgi:hypothetical protein